MIFTLFAMSLVPTVGLLQILRIEAYYTLPWVSKHTAQKRNSHSVRHRRERVNRHLVIVSGVAMDTTSSAPEKKCAPQNKSAPQKKSRRAFGASATLARRRLSNKTKFEPRTGQNVAAASAVSNTERTIERGGRTLDEQHRPFYLGGHRAQQQRLRH